MTTALVLPDPVEAAFLVVAGLILLFAGRALGKLALAVAGFVVGAGVTAVLGILLVAAGPVYLAVVLGGGLLGALLFLLLWRAASVVVGGFAGWALGTSLAALLGAATVWPWGAAGAVAGALVGLFVKDVVLVVGSAVAGAWLVVSAVALVGPDLLAREDVRLAVLLGLATVGAFVQFRNR